MGPNAKRRSRKQYVKYRLRILTDLRIAWPDQKKIDEMLDESKTSEIMVDNIFADIIRRSAERRYL